MEDKLILLRLIEGMYDVTYKHKILERLHLNEKKFRSMCRNLSDIGIN